MDNEEIIVKFMKYAWDLGISVEVGRSQRYGELEMLALRCRTHNATSQLVFIDWFEMAYALKSGMAEKIAQDLCVPAFEPEPPKEPSDKGEVPAGKVPNCS